MDTSHPSLPATGSVLGIDIGFSITQRSSAICRLDWDKSYVRLSIARFRVGEPERTQTIQQIADRPVLVTAFDGPLRGDLAIIGQYRRAEQILTRQLQPFIGKPGQSNVPVGKLLNRHTNDCARIILDLGVTGDAHHPQAIHPKAIVEAFPNAFLGLMIAEPKRLETQRNRRSDIYYEHLVDAGTLSRLLAFLLPDRSVAPDFASITNHDDRAAVICALTALGVAAGCYSAAGDANGWIILPPAGFIQPWSLPLLRANGGEGGFVTNP